jgi:hypothetical protein
LITRRHPTHRSVELDLCGAIFEARIAGMLWLILYQAAEKRSLKEQGERKRQRDQ